MTMEIPEPRGADAVPDLIGRHVRLRQITGDDYPFLLELQTRPENMVRWRFRGTTPAPEQLLASLWQGVLAQFLVVRVDNGQPVGLVVAYDADLRHRHVHLAMVIAPEHERTGWTLEALVLFINYLFETFAFRKIYFDMVEFNYQRVASGAGRLFHVEGCFRDHELHLGRLWHLYVLAIYADEWSDAIKDIAPHLAAPRERVR